MHEGTAQNAVLVGAFSRQADCLRSVILICCAPHVRACARFVFSSPIRFCGWLLIDTGTSTSARSRSACAAKAEVLQLLFWASQS